MSETPETVTTTKSPEVASATPSPSWVDNFKTSTGTILGNWKVKLGLVLGLVAAAFIGVSLLAFFWQHDIAVLGMKGWAAHSGAKPIDCMIKDTNGDQYVSCTALLDQQVVPLECGASIFNIGCRVNYGAAAPNLRLMQPRASSSVNPRL